MTSQSQHGESDMDQHRAHESEQISESKQQSRKRPCESSDDSHEHPLKRLKILQTKYDDTYHYYLNMITQMRLSYGILSDHFGSIQQKYSLLLTEHENTKKLLNELQTSHDQNELKLLEMEMTLEEKEQNLKKAIDTINSDRQYAENQKLSERNQQLFEENQQFQEEIKTLRNIIQLEEINKSLDKEMCVKNQKLLMEIEILRKNQQ